MAGILDELCTHFALSVLSLTMGYCVWGSFPKEKRRLSRTSMLCFRSLLQDEYLKCVRERREHRIFRTLLQMIPGIEERLMEGSDEDVVHVAELV